MKISFIDFNVMNDTKKNNYDGGNSPLKLSNIIKTYNVNIACLQEVNDNYKDKLMNFLEGYQFYGDNRFKKNSPWYGRFNENMGVISNLSVSECRTIALAKKNKHGKRSLFSILPRIATVVKLTSNIVIINTHLDHLSNIARKKQLEYLKDIIRDYKECPVILTGDFNLNTDDELFQDFVLFMDACGCRLVEIDTNTFKGSVKLLTPDHVFIPNNYNVLNFQVIDTALSDHRLIFLEIETK